MNPEGRGLTVGLLVALALALMNVPSSGTDSVRMFATFPTGSYANSPARGWTDGTQAIHPPAVAGSMMAYDSRTHLFVLFGGSDGEVLNQTWVLNPSTRVWEERYPAVSPPARADAMLIYDNSADALILFGGWYETHEGLYNRLSDTWAFFVENDTWVEMHPRTSPTPRSDAAVAYDETEGVTLLFGGFDGVRYLGDVWYYVYANNTWVNRLSARLPSPRADGRMVYDSEHQSFFVFSGNDYSDADFNFHHPADMWRYRWAENTWRPIFPDSMPAPRDYAVLASNLMFGELLLVGGYGNRTILGDTWAFNTTQLIWRNISTPGGPSARMAAAGGYDPVEHVLVMFGGGNRTEVKADTWFFRYPPPLSGAIFLSAPSPIVGQPVMFQAGIVGGSGILTKASWIFCDCQTNHGLSAAHSFGAPGIYRIQFSGRDNRDDEISWTIELDVGLWIPLWMDVTVALLGIVAATTVIVIWKR